MTASIRNPDLLLIKNREMNTSAYGCDQHWFSERWQRQAGCGPCTAATILYYLARSLDFHDLLSSAGSFVREDFSHFMSDIWNYVTPGRLGVNEASILAVGVIRYAAAHGVILRSEVCKVPSKRSRTALYADFANFIRQGLDSDCPVAFLNLSNGHLKGLDSWHWVTITSLDDNGQAGISDSGVQKRIELQHWYQSSWLGGAAVWFTVEA